MANWKQDGMMDGTVFDNREMHFEVLRGAVENTNEAFVTIDQQSRIVLFNKAAERIFGYSRDEVIGQDIGLLLTPMCESGHRQAVNRYIGSRQPTLIGHESELTVARKNGETFPASISFSVAEVDGQLFFTGIVRDFTERKVLERQLIHSERLAALGQAVAEISHEIKNPLIMIGGFARQLQKKISNDKDRAKLQIISEEVERLEKLLAGLKDLYRPRSLLFEEVNLLALLDEVRELVEDEARRRGIGIHLDPASEEVRARGDREKLKQVFLNLIKNSMEALPAGGTVRVAAKSSADRVEVQIADAGEGIPDELKERLFSPFFTTKEQGTGLGLCISKRIIDDHPGGSFQLESTAGEGTVVTLSFPRCPSPGNPR